MHKAHIRDNPMADGVDLALVNDLGSLRTITNWGRPAVRTYDPQDNATQASDDEWLTLPDDAARAIYEALAKHYGHMPTDSRLLREDYLAERARVDRLIGLATGTAS